MILLVVFIPTYPVLFKLTILFEESDSLAVIHLNRPKKLNAFNQAMLHDLLNALDHVDSQDSIKALIITGSGEAFCAGADLSS